MLGIFCYNSSFGLQREGSAAAERAEIKSICAIKTICRVQSALVKILPGMTALRLQRHKHAVF